MLHFQPERLKSGLNREEPESLLWPAVRGCSRRQIPNVLIIERTITDNRESKNAAKYLQGEGKKRASAAYIGMEITEQRSERMCEKCAEELSVPSLGEEQRIHWQKGLCNELHRPSAPDAVGLAPQSLPHP